MPLVHEADRSRLLDNWRGWAIIFVLLGHFGHVPGANLGRLGVELFFVLSGRLMADLLFVKQIALPRFYYRRFTRVLPVSLLFVLVAYLFFPKGILFLSGEGALASATMVVNFTQLVGIGSAVTDHYWSLCVEEHSYIALGLIALLSRRAATARSPRAIATICLGLAALMMLNGWRLWHDQPDYYKVYWRSDVRAATIFVSAGIRMLFVAGIGERFKTPWMPLGALLGGLILNSNHVPDPVKYSLGSVLVALSMNSIEQLPSGLKSLLTTRLIGWLGVVSYSLYIWQQPFFYLIDRYGAMSMAAGALATGLVSFYVYENPLRTRLNRIALRKKHVSASAEVADTAPL